MKTIKALVEPSLKERIDKKLKATNQKQSEVIRQLMIDWVGQEADIKPEIKNLDASHLESKRLYIHAPKFISDFVAEGADKRGISINKYLLNLLQVHCLSVPIMTDKELVELRQANRQLLAIGRNLNQITKAINSSMYDKDNFADITKIKLSQINETLKVINNSKEKIDDLTTASLHTWRLKNDENLG